MSGAAPTRASGSSTHHDHSSTRKPYQNTVDQARAHAAELGPDMAPAFDQLSHKTALVLRAYVAAVYQEGHSYREIESIRDAMRQYFEDNFRCWGTCWQFLPDQAETTIGTVVVKAEEGGEWVGNPVFDVAFVSLMQELQAQDEKADRTRWAKRRTTVAYDDLAKLMLYLQKPATIKMEGAGKCLFFQAFLAVGFVLWLTYVFFRVSLRSCVCGSLHS